MKSLRRKLAVGFLIVVVGAAAFAWLILAKDMPQGGATWSGVDESVIERYAAAAGREARDPFINTDQGDLLLFAFAFGGAAGGFVAGYCWRRLIGEKR